jgi:hypothetical protein
MRATASRSTCLCRLSAATLLSWLMLACLCTFVPRVARAQAAPVAALPPSAAASAASASEVFHRMSAETWISRVVTLADLGLGGPIVLGYRDTTRGIALPG